MNEEKFVIVDEDGTEINAEKAVTINWKKLAKKAAIVAGIAGLGMAIGYSLSVSDNDTEDNEDDDNENTNEDLIQE